MAQRGPGITLPLAWLSGLARFKGITSMDEPELIAFYDSDRQLKQIASTDIVKVWDMGRKFRVDFPGGPLADDLLRNG